LHLAATYRDSITPRYACTHNPSRRRRLVKEADDLACDVLSPRLLVVHDAGGGGEDDVAELTRWQKLDNPLLHVAELDVVARADDTSLVEAGERLISILLDAKV